MRTCPKCKSAMMLVHPGPIAEEWWCRNCGHTELFDLAEEVTINGQNKEKN